MAAIIQSNGARTASKVAAQDRLDPRHHRQFAVLSVLSALAVHDPEHAGVQIQMRQLEAGQLRAPEAGTLDDSSALEPTGPALMAIQNNRLSILTGLVRARPIFHVQDRFIQSTSANAPNKGGSSGLFDPTRSIGSSPIFVFSAIGFMLAPETHSAPSGPSGNWSTMSGVRFA